MAKTYRSLTLNSDLSQFDQDELSHMFEYAMDDSNLPMIDKINQYLCYSDEFIMAFRS